MPQFYEPAIPFAEQTSPIRAKIGAAVAARLRATPGVGPIDTDKAELFYCNDFLTDADCEMLIGMIDANCIPSPMFQRTGYEGFRTSQSCNLDRWHKDVLRIDTRIAMLLGIEPRHGETVQGQRYAPGQQFKPHPDFFYVDQPYWAAEEKGGGQRTWTAMAYLNEPDRGGETSFPYLNIAFKPRKRMLLIWNNMGADGAPNPWTTHEGAPVISGTKYIITKWFREKRWI